MGNYPKGSLLLFCQYVDGYQRMETVVLDVLKDEYTPRPDIGREYIEGDIDKVIATIQETIKNAPRCNNDDVDNQPEEGTTLPSAASDEDLGVPMMKPDPDVMISKFMDAHRQLFNDRVMRSTEVYDTFSNWVAENKDVAGRSGRRISHKRFIAGLRDNFGITAKPHRFEDGISLGLSFQRVAEPKSKEENSICKFVAEHIVKSSSDTDKKNASYFTLKQAKELFQRQQYYNGRVATLKHALEQELKTICTSQKWIQNMNVSNVFMGFELVDNVASPLGGLKHERG